MRQHTIEEINEAAGRLHATAWSGKALAPETMRARFSVPRQPTDDNEIVYAAIRELEALRERVASSPRSASIEECARHVEGHSCVATCCDAQPSAGDAKSLADCIRRLSTRPTRPLTVRGSDECETCGDKPCAHFLEMLADIESERAWIYNITAGDNVPAAHRKTARACIDAERARLTSFRQRMVAAEARVKELEAQAERLRRMFLECWVCKAALCEPRMEPPHCTDCQVSEEAFHEWEEWFLTPQKDSSR